MKKYVKECFYLDNNNQDYQQNDENKFPNQNISGNNPFTDNYGNNFYSHNTPNNNYIPPQNNYNEPFNRQYADDSVRKSSKGVYILLITVIICFAVIIFLMFTLMHSMIDGGNRKSDSNNNIMLSENFTGAESQTEIITTAPPVTTALRIETVTEIVTVIVEVTSPPATEPVVQQPSFNPYTYTINNYCLPIFKDSRYDSDITGYITDKGTYTIVDQSGNWGKLKSGAGWINFDDASSEGRVSYIGAGYVSTESDPLNLRTAPDKNSKTLTSIPKNTSVEVYATDADGWYYTTYKGKSGFVNSQYITFGNPPAISVGEFYGSGVIATQKDPLNVRSEPSKNASIITAIPKGTSVDLYSTNEPDWFYTTYNGKSGFVKSDYISFCSHDYNYVESLTAYINTKSDPLNLRASASTDSAIVTAIPKGTSVTVIDYGDSWCYIEWNGYTGYASTQYLAF